MPELPEVETIKLGLQKRINGLEIKKILINSQKSFIGEPGLVKNKKVINIWRRGKVLGIDLENNLSLMFHLKMSGQLILVKGQKDPLGENKFMGGHPTKDMKGEMPNKHTRIEFLFSDGSNLYFNDQRKFGWVRVVATNKIEEESFFKKLGPDPLGEKFNLRELKDNLYKHPKTAIKVAILDQTVVSGIGNIYACEACFLAGVDPRKRVGELGDEEFKKLYQAIIKVLKNGIKYGGSSKTHFVDAQGNKGFFLDHAFVYGKDKKDCKKCGVKIKKIKLGGRGTYLCPNCQS